MSPPISDTGLHILSFCVTTANVSLPSSGVQARTTAGLGMSRPTPMAHAVPTYSPWGTHCLHGQDEASGSSSVADRDACTTRNDPLPTNVSAAQDVPQGLSKQLKHGGREQMQNSGDGGYRRDESGPHELRGFALGDQTEVVYLQVTRSQCRRASSASASSSASATFVLMTSCEVCASKFSSQ